MKNLRIIDKGTYKIYKMDLEIGEVAFTVYDISDFLKLIYKDASGKGEICLKGELLEGLSIDFIQEGSLEDSRCKNENCLVKDMTVIEKHIKGEQKKYALTSNEYKGISIIIDYEKLNKNVKKDSLILDVVEKFFNHHEDNLENQDNSYNKLCYRDMALAQKFRELYKIPESIKEDYIKIKVLEILLYLRGMENVLNTLAAPYTPQQLVLAKSVEQYLLENMDKRVTLDMLVERFKVSGSNIKKAFKNVYGISVYAYIRREKMEAAAVRICESDENILSIAGDFGYDNGSKFAKAFREIKGMSPTDYRLKYGYNMDFFIKD